MKKVIALLLSILLAFSCAACAGGNISDQSSGSSDTPATEAPAQTSGESRTAPSAESAAWPQKNMTLVITFKAGGAMDVNCRLLAQYWSKYLGVPINLENHDGSNGQVGMTYVHESNVDDMIVMCSAQTYLSSTILAQNAAYGIDDFTILNFTEIDPSCIVCLNDKWDSFEALNQDVLANPGKYRFGVNAGGGAAVVAALLIDHYGWDVKTVNYSGGNDLHTAVLAKEVDFACGQMEAAISYADYYNVLCTCGDERNALFPDTPLLSELLGDEAPFMGTFRFIAVKREFAEKYPEYYQLLCDSLEKVYSDPEYLAALKASNLEEFMSWKGPEYSAELNMQIHELTTQYLDAMMAVN